MTTRREDDPRPALVSASARFYERGWMAGTAGNLSARASEESLWITPSGRPKGDLAVEDLIRVGRSGQLAEGETRRPSAETALHTSVYYLFPSARFCYHVHTIEANLVTRLTTADSVPLPPLEMLKGFGILEENPRVEIPIFPNHREVARIAADVRGRFEHMSSRIPAFLIRDHGMTFWASDPVEAMNHAELLDYILRYLIAAHAAGLPVASWGQPG